MDLVRAQAVEEGKKKKLLLLLLLPLRRGRRERGDRRREERDGSQCRVSRVCPSYSRGAEEGTLFVGEGLGVP
eukprot:5796949-Pyramimonas_sp.AAC.1